MKINNEIVNFWKSLNEDLIKNNPFLKRVPQFYVKPKENSILFIGLNPSFQEDRFNDIELKLNPDNFFESKIEEIDVIKIAEFGKKSHDEKEENYYGRYFDDLNYISNHLLDKYDGVNFEQCDMFLMRETQAGKVEKLIKSNNEFRVRQIEILKEYVDQAKPRMIIIPNSVTSNNYMKYVLNIPNQKFIAKNDELIKQILDIDQYIKNIDNDFKHTLEINDNDGKHRVKELYENYRKNERYNNPKKLIKYSYEGKIPTILWKTFQHGHLSNLQREILILELKQILELN